MRFLLDANLSPALVKALGLQFPNSAHVRDVGLQAATDDKIWNYAADGGLRDNVPPRLKSGH